MSAPFSLHRRLNQSFHVHLRESICSPSTRWSPSPRRLSRTRPKGHRPGWSSTGPGFGLAGGWFAPYSLCVRFGW